jgi:DNA polymerase III sliding clamp (beta) subunit (PCNA family)
MKIILDCKKTLTVLQQLKAVAPKFTSSLPVIEYIKVVATDDGIFFTATNLDEFVTTMINGQCGEPGTCLIQPAKLLKLLSGKKGTFSVCGQDSDTVISIGSLNIQREKEDPLFTVDDFPEIPVVEYEEEFVHF